MRLSQIDDESLSLGLSARSSLAGHMAPLAPWVFHSLQFHGIAWHMLLDWNTEHGTCTTGHPCGCGIMSLTHTEAAPPQAAR